MTSRKIEKAATAARVSEQKSLQVFSAGRKSHREKRAQLEQLLQYKADYETSLAERGSEGMEAGRLRDYRAFLAKLNAAIEQQQRELAEVEGELQSKQAHWIASTKRTRALDQLVDERQREELRVRDKAEQKRADEEATVRQFDRNNT